MAYGPGTSLSGLSFTPAVAIMIGQYSSSVTGYYTWVAIKGYDTSSKLACVTKRTSSPDAAYAKCSFGSNSISFSDYNSNFKLYDYNAYVAAFGT